MKYIAATVLSLVSLSSTAQEARPLGTICKIPIVQENHTISGDTARARKAYNPAYEDTVGRLVVKLGYLYKDSATKQEFYDNFLVGLRVLRFNRYKVVKYAISYLPHGADYIPGIMTPITAPLANTYWNIMRFHPLMPGDKIYFDTEVQKDGASYTLKMPVVEIKIIPDRNR